MNRRILALLCVCVVGVLWMCSKDDMDIRLLEEEKTLAEYLSTNFPDAIDLGGGAFLVKTREREEGTTIEAGNFILWNRKITNQITEEIEYTSEKSSTKYIDSYVDGGPEITVVLAYKIDEGLMRMKKGEKGDVYIPSRWLFCDFQPRIFSIEIVDVIKSLPAHQEALMSGYIRKLQHKNPKVDTIPDVVSTIDKTAYNVMYFIMDEGTGEAISEGMNIETKTSISYLIQENKEHEYMVNQDRTWSTKSGEKINDMLTKTNCIGEILKKMKKGGKVVVTLPSKLYWEDDKLPKNGYGQFYIPKWSVAIFTITIK